MGNRPQVATQLVSPLAIVGTEPVAGG